MHQKNISRIIAAAAVTALCTALSVFSAAAADASDSPKSKALPIIVLTLIFAVTLIASTVITYKLRTRSLTQQKNDNVGEQNEEQ